MHIAVWLKAFSDIIKAACYTQIVSYSGLSGVLDSSVTMPADFCSSIHESLPLRHYSLNTIGVGMEALGYLAVQKQVSPSPPDFDVKICTPYFCPFRRL